MPNSLPRPRYSHVVFQTRRFDAMKQWYCGVFGAEVVHEDPALCFLTYDDECHRFALANLDILKPDAAGGNSDVGINHIAYTFASAAELLETYARLKAQDIIPYWPVHHGMTLSLYYRDPDGNRLEFQVDTLPSEQAKHFMRGDSFAANPIGIEFDPDALLARYRAGAGEAELLAAPEGTPAGIPAAHGLG
jgi:catechol 2,3-dioxygenase-like lactoylglutathione lyase family enzyme